jgi:PleD family two-component response regulator
VSIGIAQLKKGQSFREFLRVADKNLYSAKNKGRNLVHYGAMSVTEAV